MVNRLFALALLAGLVGSCRPHGLHAAEAASPSASKSAEADQPREGAADYLLQPFDLLHFEVYDERDLNLDVRISQEFTIALPLVGSLDLRGLSLRSASELIRQRYAARYLRNPQVTLQVKEYSVRTVSVLGSVNKPGTIRFQPEQSLSLIEAIAEAGGFTRLADKSKVKLTRSKSDGTSSTEVVDMEALISGRQVAEWLLQPRDVIFVPERIL